METIEKTCPECSGPFLWRVGQKGVQTYCSQSCRLKYWRRERRAADPEKVRAEDRAAHYRNRDKRVARMRAYAEKHRDQMRQQGREWRAANLEYARDRDRARWAGDRRTKSNKERGVKAQQARLSTPWNGLLKSAEERARRKGVPFSIDRAWAEASWTGRCAVSGLPFKLGLRERGPKFWSPSIDRIKADIGYTPENCRFVLWAVNSFKHDATDEDMYLVAEALLKYRSSNKA
jgi:hypothetical protein